MRAAHDVQLRKQGDAFEKAEKGSREREARLKEAAEAFKVQLAGADAATREARDAEKRAVATKERADDALREADA